jgi:hypothetical protein
MEARPKSPPEGPPAFSSWECGAVDSSLRESLAGFPTCTCRIGRSVLAFKDFVFFFYRRTSISGTTFSGKKCLSGTIFHAT